MQGALGLDGEAGKVAQRKVNSGSQFHTCAGRPAWGRWGRLGRRARAQESAPQPVHKCWRRRKRCEGCSCQQQRHGTEAGQETKRLDSNLSRELRPGRRWSPEAQLKWQGSTMQSAPKKPRRSGLRARQRKCQSGLLWFPGVARPAALRFGLC